jgi:hypothetical protein
MFIASPHVLSKSLINLRNSASYANERFTTQRFGNGLKSVVLSGRKEISISHPKFFFTFSTISTDNDEFTELHHFQPFRHFHIGQFIAFSIKD